MKPRLTDEEIANLRELEAEATAGPWSMNRRDWGASVYGNGGAEVASMSDKTSATIDKWRASLEQCVDDAALIVAMRNALTQLLDERDGLSRVSLTVRQAAKMRVPLDGADAQAMEHALTITERELAEEQKLLGEMHEDSLRLRVLVSAANDSMEKMERDLYLKMQVVEDERDEMKRALTDEQKLIGEMHEDNRRLTVENAKLRQKVWWVLPTDREKKAP